MYFCRRGYNIISHNNYYNYYHIIGISYTALLQIYTCKTPEQRIFRLRSGYLQYGHIIMSVPKYVPSEHIT